MDTCFQLAIESGFGNVRPVKAAASPAHRKKTERLAADSMAVRFPASTLVNDVLMQIVKHVDEKYQGADYFSLP